MLLLLLLLLLRLLLQFFFFFVCVLIKIVDALVFLVWESLSDPCPTHQETQHTDIHKIQVTSRVRLPTNVNRPKM